MQRLTKTPLLISAAQAIFWLSSERLSRSALHLIEEGETSLYSCSLQSCDRNVLHRPPCEDTYILHLSDYDHLLFFFIKSFLPELGISLGNKFTPAETRAGVEHGPGVQQARALTIEPRYTL
jgi:hypothetical protein